MKSSAWLALILLFTPCLAEAQNSAYAPDRQADYNKIVSRFFEMVKAGKYTDAAHVLVDTNPQDAFSVEKHEALALPLQKIADTLGPFKDFKPLVTKTLGDSIGYVYGLAIYERSPIRFEFMFYKDGSSWRLLHIDFNLDYVPEIRELAGVHIPLRLSAAPPPSSLAPRTPEKTEPPGKPATLPGPPTLSTPAAPYAQPTTPPATPPGRPATPPASTPSPSPSPTPSAPVPTP